MSETRKFLNWILYSSKFSFLRDYMLTGEGGLNNMETSLASYIWEADGDDQVGKLAYFNYLSHTYRNEYRRNQERIGSYDEYAHGRQEDWNPFELFENDVDPYGFTMLSEYSSIGRKGEGGDRSSLGEELPSLGERQSSSLSAIRMSNKPLHGSDGRSLGTLDDYWQRWLGKRTESELDILNTWLHLQPISWDELAVLCDTTKDEVARVYNLIAQFGQRHKEKYDKHIEAREDEAMAGLVYQS